MKEILLGSKSNLLFSVFAVVIFLSFEIFSIWAWSVGNPRQYLIHKYDLLTLDQSQPEQQLAEAK